MVFRWIFVVGFFGFLWDAVGCGSLVAFYFSGVPPAPCLIKFLLVYQRKKQSHGGVSTQLVTKSK